MTPDKAIELNEHILITKPHHITPDYEEAINLGIEALKRLKWTRECPTQSPYELLPGEAEE